MAGDDVAQHKGHMRLNQQPTCISNLRLKGLMANTWPAGNVPSGVLGCVKISHSVLPFHC